MITKDKVFLYNGNTITFQNGDGILVNATEMAKSFGKRPVDWLRLPSTQEFIKELAEVRKSHITQLVVTAKGGNDRTAQGTWMHEDVALEFARWLSPAFAIWCNDRIKELLKTGVATIRNDDEAIAYAMRVLNERLEASRAENERLTFENHSQQRMIEQKNEEIAHNAPKVAFANAIIGSQKSCLVGELAKLLTQNGCKIGQNRLFEWLRKNSYLGTKGERYNIPNQQYIEQGLFELKKGVRSGNDGVMINTITTKVTPKGQQYFVSKFLGA